MYDYVNRNKGDSSDDDDDLDDAAEDKDTAVNMDNAKKSDSSDNSVVEVPDDFIFSGCMAFRLWGPFAEPEDGILIFENNDSPKNAAALSRASKHKLDLEVKDMDRALDQSSNRGFSTDQ